MYTINMEKHIVEKYVGNKNQRKDVEIDEKYYDAREVRRCWPGEYRSVLTCFKELHREMGGGGERQELRSSCVWRR